jgi:hypothetical protein
MSSIIAARRAIIACSFGSILRPLLSPVNMSKKFQTQPFGKQK